MNIIRQLFAIGPILFGLSFIAPLINQILIRMNWDVLSLSYSGLIFIISVPTLCIGLIIGVGWGVAAYFLRTWI